MNSMQLNAIRDNTHILNTQNIVKYLNTMERKIKEFDLTPFVEYIKNQNF
ncbi:hypothetical protein OLU54_03005 [Campylobacter jejuni]|nr:hypothetical protein [Campylobacter jejuni]MCW1377022.1 hypothetical protein [Campylobacter jejuni]MCW1455767.1 hypothetical protein [Campylobacter jejuni]MCW1532478.1 hypothetical protein [Campylobacter jejuni]MCW1706906.1 hypothetical protein [Campylobacter jejuni]